MNAPLKNNLKGSAVVIDFPAIPLRDGAFYWISRKTGSGFRCEPELARFCEAVPGRSLYKGKWEIFGLKTPLYHDDKKFTVLSSVPQPKVRR